MTPLTIALVIISILLVTTILLQQRSAGLGGAFGGDLSVFTGRRGAEKSLFRFTILLGIALIAVTLLYAHSTKPVTSNVTTTANPNGAALANDAAATTDTNTAAPAANTASSNTSF